MTRLVTNTRTLSTADFAVPIDERYFEDYTPGAVYEYGHLTVTEDDIVGFAEQFDPQPIHTNREFAEAGPFAGLIASGWHSAGLLMRLFADHYLSRVASLASPGVDELRWAGPATARGLRTPADHHHPGPGRPGPSPTGALCIPKPNCSTRMTSARSASMAMNILRRRNNGG